MKFFRSETANSKMGRLWNRGAFLGLSQFSQSWGLKIPVLFNLHQFKLFSFFNYYYFKNLYKLFKNCFYI